MPTEAIFENIAERIQQEIGRAQKSIVIAVAWFTNKNIFTSLLSKAQSGCTISLMISNDEINNNSQINFTELAQYNSKFYKIGNGETELMHNKFCVIDYSTVITGSYNWSYKAESNFENIIITANDTALAEQFISEFNQIRKKYFPEEQKTEVIFPLEKIIKRLEILKNYILLEDVEEFKTEISKLSEYKFNSDIFEIISAIESREFGIAVNRIQNFISLNQQLAVWNDPVVPALKLEMKLLENQLNAFDNEKIELEKLLSDFHYRHSIELGTIILEILKLRKLKFKDDKKKSEEAENDYQQYNEAYQKEKEKKQFDLTVIEKIDLKQKFRRASFLCHPDKVEDKFKSDAQKTFIELKAAYDANDLKKVVEILDELEKGNFFRNISDTVSEKEKLKAAISKLRRKIKELENEILTIKQSEAYKTISSIADWNNYFAETKEKLAKELEELKNEILNIKNN